MREQYGLTMDEKPKTRFGNYELVRRIDVGGMGEVYLAHQLTAFGRPVAIKIIRNDLVHDITARARFLREAEVSAHLKHEHILPLYDFGEVDGRLFLVTPYIEGGTLATRLKDRGPLSLNDTLRLFVPLVQAVGYIHRRGVIHRDLKPTNVMLDTEDGEVYVRLIDFGIASLQGYSASAPLTTAGNEVGTIAYMAPERLSGVAAPSNDIFSLGVILHQMLTGRMPVPKPTSSTPSAPRLPESLAQVVQRSIAVDPAERYTTTEDLLQGFEQAYQQVLSQTQSGTFPAEPGTSSLATNRLRLDLSDSLAGSRRERVSLADSGEMAALVPKKPVVAAPRTPVLESFVSDDYNAPTTLLEPSQQYTQPPTRRPPLLKLQQRPRKPQTSRKRSSWLLLLSTAILTIVLIIGAMLFYGYQTVSATSVTVNFAPQVHTISQVFSVKADPNLNSVNSARAAIPARFLPISQTSHQQGDTTGQSCPIFCPRTVSQDDVNRLEEQIKGILEPSISRELHDKISELNGIQVGGISFSNQTVTSQPGVSQVADTVTVTLTEQGQAVYILKSDATKVAHDRLLATNAQMGQGFQALDSTITIGSPVITNIDIASGLIDINVPAGAVAIYQFSQDQLRQISNTLVGESLTKARDFLKNQQGIDPSSIRIHFLSGNGSTMPSDTQHIQLIPLSPGTLPNVSLTPVQGINNGN